MDFHTYALRIAAALIRRDATFAAGVFSDACLDRSLGMSDLSRLVSLFDILRG
jgi:hypothetical protein